MANRTFNPPRALEKELVTLVGKVAIGADAAVGTKVGRGFSVAKTATGEYTVTLQDKYAELLGASFSVEGSGTIVVLPELKSEAVAASGSLIVKTTTKSTGATADTAVAFTLRITLHLRNSSVA
jgi:hypothetical protein